MTKLDLRKRLNDWGRWSRDLDLGIDYPKQASGIEGANREKVESLDYTEIDVLEIEKALCALKKFDELGFEIIKAYYKNNVSLNKIASEIHRSKKYVYQVFHGAEMFIYGFLNQI